MKRLGWSLIAFIVALLLRGMLHVPPIEPTRPYATCEDRRAW